MHYKGGGQVSEGVGLLISILVRYPEVGSIYYWQEKHALKFTFIIKDLDDSTLHMKFVPVLELYHELEGSQMQICQTECRKEENVCILTITRDVESMTQNEVGLIVEFVKMEFVKQLIYEDAGLPEDELLYQEEMISQMLATIRHNDIEKNVVAVREEGRVLVFNN